MRITVHSVTLMSLEEKKEMCEEDSGLEVLVGQPVAVGNVCVEQIEDPTGNEESMQED